MNRISGLIKDTRERPFLLLSYEIKLQTAVSKEMGPLQTPNLPAP
jgi:hypothetical protein